MHITLNDQPRELKRYASISVHDLLNALNVAVPNTRIHVKINGQEVEQSMWLRSGPKHGDEVQITTD